MKNILVTGGTGFIGSAISSMLVLKGYKVTIFDNNSRGKLKNISALKEAKFIKGDIRNFQHVFKACKNIDTVIHLAAVNGTKYFYEKPDIVLEVAAKGVINIIDSCKERGIKNLFLASSSEVYHFPKKIPTDEKESIKIPDIMNPRFSYAGGKIFTELMGVNFGRKYFKKLIIFRPHNVYGKNMGNEHVVPELLLRMKKNKSKNFFIKGTGKETRAFIYIDDFIKAFELVMTKGKHMQIYNIGTEQMVSINKLCKTIAKIFKKTINIKNKPIAKGGTKARCPDISKIKKLGFLNYTLLEDGLKKVIN
jgi:nucleoside-diphosphate-sugar epimerase